MRNKRNKEYHYSNESANKAKEDFNKLPKKDRVIIGNWIKNWYLKAGYKRLGRMLVAYAKDKGL